MRAADAIDKVISSSKMMSAVTLTEAASTTMETAVSATFAALATTRAMEAISRGL